MALAIGRMALMGLALVVQQAVCAGEDLLVPGLQPVVQLPEIASLASMTCRSNPILSSSRLASMETLAAITA
ncbi:hypothetical protein WE862_12515 [Aeromonas jandaei]